MKPTAKKIAISVICSLSLVAFVFLNTVKIGKDHAQPFGVQPSSIEETLERDDNSKVKKLEHNIIPDISAVKKIFILMKKFIPAS